MWSLRRKKRLSVKANGAPKQYQKVVLINIKTVQKQLDTGEIAKRISSLGFKPVEDKVVELLADIVNQSIKAGQETANISNIFKYSFTYAFGAECFPNEAVQEIMMKELFEVVEEKNGELKVKLKR